MRNAGDHLGARREEHDAAVEAAARNDVGDSLDQRPIHRFGVGDSLRREVLRGDIATTGDRDGASPEVDRVSAQLDPRQRAGGGMKPRNLLSDIASGSGAGYQ